MSDLKENVDEVVETVKEKIKVSHTKNLYKNTDSVVEAAVATSLLPATLAFDALDTLFGLFD